MIMKLTEFWAKTQPFQSVPTHAIVSGYTAQELLHQWVSKGDRELIARDLGLEEASLTRFVGYLASIHDIGKLEYSFQVQNEGLYEILKSEYGNAEVFQPKTRHEKTGRDCLRFLWKESGENRNTADLFSKVIGAHHQGKTGNGHFRQKSTWYSVQKELEADMRMRFLLEGDNLPAVDRACQGQASALLLGLVILADWIASGDLFADAEDWIFTPDSASKVRSIVGNFLQRSNMSPQQTQWPSDFCGIWPNISKEGRRFLQKDLDELFENTENRYSMLLVEAPMGEGKTEAGVYAAIQMAKQWGKDGFYIALPTAATANQMVDRMQNLLDMHDLSASVRLLHSMAWLHDARFNVRSRDERDEAARWLAPNRRGLLGQYAVGTVDQAMLAATNVKYGILRLLGLSNKVLIIDEIHSYDTYMNEIILRLLEWCRALEIPVVMLSATLPPARKQMLLAPYISQELSEAYPLITAVTGDGALFEKEISGTEHKLRVTIDMQPILGNAARIADSAAEEVRDGGCICVLMNTVREAQEVYLELRHRYDGELLLFHAQFPAGQRAEIEKACIARYGKEKSQRPKRSILVATQVVEQSLDVDFDSMLTAVAPIDLLIQRLGRVFRHEDTPRPAGHKIPRMTVLVPEDKSRFGPSASVYPACFLKSAMRVLAGRDSIAVPEDVAQLVRDGYDPDLVPESEVRQWQENQIKEQVEAGASQQYLLNQPEKLFSALTDGFLYDDDEDSYVLSAKTRLGEPTVRIALLSQADIERLKPFLKIENGRIRAAVWDRRTAEGIMKKSISVSARRLGGNLSGNLDIKGDMLITGVRIMQMEDGCCRLPGGRSLRIDPELGLLIEGGER